MFWKSKWKRTLGDADKQQLHWRKKKAKRKRPNQTVDTEQITNDKRKKTKQRKLLMEEDASSREKRKTRQKSKYRYRSDTGSRTRGCWENRHFVKDKVRVNDVTATPYPIEQEWFPILMSVSFRSCPYEWQWIWVWVLVKRFFGLCGGVDKLWAGFGFGVGKSGEHGPRTGARRVNMQSQHAVVSGRSRIVKGTSCIIIQIMGWTLTGTRAVTRKGASFNLWIHSLTL